MLQTLSTASEYLKIAYKRYISFKQTPTYDESYKYEVLSELNEYMKTVEITPQTVGTIARKLQKENPTTGSFVHWSNTDDLANFAEAEPERVASLWNQLYDPTIPLTERIDQFREQGKAYKPTISLGAPLFGYLLAAYDYTVYPLYKEEVFKDLKKSYGIESKFGAVSKNYSEYLTFCEEVLAQLQIEHENLTMLDVQDFFFCSTQYSKIVLEAAVDYVYGVAQDLQRFKEEPSYLLDELKQLDQDALENLKRTYVNKEKINRIKYLLVEAIVNEQDVSIRDLERIKAQVNEQYDTNILHSWNNFTIMFQLYNVQIRDKVKEELRKIHESIINFDELSEFTFTPGKVLNDFSWNQNFGGSESWVAVYEEKYSNHKKAPQLFMSISGEIGVRYGLVHGSEHVQTGVEDVEIITDMEEFTYERFRQKIVEVSSLLREVESPTPSEVTEVVISKEKWIELMNVHELFKKSDFAYLFTMYEMGGEATAKDLSLALGIHPSSFTSQMLALAKRVQRETALSVATGSSEEEAFLRLLFTGDYADQQQHKWTLQDNLQEAIAIKYEESNLVEKEAYSRGDFLNEVFMEASDYDKLASLLHYKKNIILQGPPGVGKTFVSKRLAYSLMGQKDDARVEMIQFHQTYSYEDFVMGYRPGDDGFSLEYGVFYDFCKRAEENPEKDYYFIIDEINRGNLSKIFGELFMLIERDKREEYVTMGYSKEKFTVPSNVYLIGTMNTADRSLAQLEVALRRRFAFFTLTPAFNSKWKKYMEKKGVSTEIVERIASSTHKMNAKITNDFQLGKGYEIGHSFFTSPPHSEGEEHWFETIIQFEILPLLEEYYFDRPEEVRSLLEGI